MTNRLYNGYGSTPMQFDVSKVVDPQIRSLVENVIYIMKESDIDPRDIKTYCMETMDIYFSEFFVRLATEQRKKSNI